MKPLCIYHGNCADGFAAALAVRMALGKENVDFHAGVYQDPPPDVTNRKVIMVDFSYKRDVLEEMRTSAQSILILDHHKSAVEELSEYPEAPHGEIDLETNQVYVGWLPNSGTYTRFDLDKSGAVLAWEHFHATPPPKMFLHIQDRDLWKFEMNHTREFQAFLFSHPYDFDLWEEFLHSSEIPFNFGGMVAQGSGIERKHFKDIREFIEAAGYRMTIAGHDVPVLNAPYFWSSDAGHIMGKGEPFAACYWDTPAGRVFSLRSADDGLDVAQIAKQFGGGGHEHSAGFRVNIGRADLSKKETP